MTETRARYVASAIIAIPGWVVLPMLLKGISDNHTIHAQPGIYGLLLGLVVAGWAAFAREVGWNRLYRVFLR